LLFSTNENSFIVNRELVCGGDKMRPTSNLAFCVAIALAAPAVAQDAISETIKLGQSGSPGETPNPDCSDGTGISAGEVARTISVEAVAQAASNNAGPLAGFAVKRVAQTNANWLDARLGRHDGKAKCGSLCVYYLRKPGRVPRACLSEPGLDRLNCVGGMVFYDIGSLPDVAVTDFSVTSESGSNYDVFCATAKNWSAEGDRLFYIAAIEPDARKLIGDDWFCSRNCSGPTHIYQDGARRLHVINERGDDQIADFDPVNLEVIVPGWIFRGSPLHGSLGANWKEISWADETIWSRR
jgi:hypothetical protein